MGAYGILTTCSAFGPAIDRLIDTLPIPSLNLNEAMFRTALLTGKPIGMLATFDLAVATMTDEFHEFVAETSSTATLTTVLVVDDIDLLKGGGVTSHNRLVAARAHELAEYDAIMLAPFSTSQAAEAVRQVVSVPVMTAPHAAVDRIRALVVKAAQIFA